MIAGAKRFLAIATTYAVCRRALISALIVGIILALINYGDKVLAGALNKIDIAKILLTFLVPYGVSTVSSVLAAQERLHVPDAHPDARRQ